MPNGVIVLLPVLVRRDVFMFPQTEACFPCPLPYSPDPELLALKSHYHDKAKERDEYSP